MVPESCIEKALVLSVDSRIASISAEKEDFGKDKIKQENARNTSIFLNARGENVKLIFFSFGINVIIYDNTNTI